MYDACHSVTSCDPSTLLTVTRCADKAKAPPRLRGRSPPETDPDLIARLTVLNQVLYDAWQNYPLPSMTWREYRELSFDDRRKLMPPVVREAYEELTKAERDVLDGVGVPGVLRASWGLEMRDILVEHLGLEAKAGKTPAAICGEAEAKLHNVNG